jgi:hypothetical protein
MLHQNSFNIYFAIILYACIICPVLSDAESGFSQGCYSACPRKIWTLESSSREDIDK